VGCVGCVGCVGGVGGVGGVGVWGVWGCGGCGGVFPLRSNIPRSALCATLDTYLIFRLDIFDFLQSIQPIVRILLMSCCSST
jgi:hypothetical protein